MTKIVRNSTGVEWVVYDENLDAYWRDGQQWTVNQAFTTCFTSGKAAQDACERSLMLSPDIEEGE